jgi:molybdopterin adenylyltransferase
MTRPAKVLTVSDGVASGHRDDTGGRGLAEHLAAHDFEVVDHVVIPDGRESVAQALTALAADFCGLIATTGGTGFGPRDLTPEGTRDVIDREAPGLAEAMRAISPFGRLSRGRAGTIGSALVVNLPGSPKGAIEQIDAVIDVLGHALDLLAGTDRTH